ncbi:hypothetical protein RCL1_005327 [Eukaryota sp. TZLM3-RCL]
MSKRTSNESDVDLKGLFAAYERGPMRSIRIDETLEVGPSDNERTIEISPNEMPVCFLSGYRNGFACVLASAPYSTNEGICRYYGKTIAEEQDSGLKAAFLCLLYWLSTSSKTLPKAIEIVCSEEHFKKLEDLSSGPLLDEIQLVKESCPAIDTDCHDDSVNFYLYVEFPEYALELAKRGSEGEFSNEFKKLNALIPEVSLISMTAVSIESIDVDTVSFIE